MCNGIDHKMVIMSDLSGLAKMVCYALFISLVFIKESSPFSDDSFSCTPRARVIDKNELKEVPLSEHVLKVPVVDEGLTEAASLSTPKGVFPLSWSPADLYLAVGNYTPSLGDELEVYQFNSLTKNLSLVASMRVGAPVYMLDWHPALNYIAVGVTGSSGDEVRVYSFSPLLGMLTLLDTISLAHGALVSVSWDPLGSYLALGVRGKECGLQLHLFSGLLQSFTSMTFQSFFSRYNLFWDTVRFSPDGNYLAVGGCNGAQILSVNRATGEMQQAAEEFSGYSRAIDWSSFNNWISVGVATAPNFLRLYQFNQVEGTVSLKPNESPVEAQPVLCMRWHPTGRFLCSGPMGGNGTTLKLYGLQDVEDLVNPQLVELQRVSVNGSIYAMSWSHNGFFLAVTMSSRTIKIYSLDVTETNPLETFIGNLL